jgi:hypothetical protein
LIGAVHKATSYANLWELFESSGRCTTLPEIDE